MGNLNGKTFDNQIKNAHKRLYAFKKPRYQCDDHKTHGDETKKKRKMYLEDTRYFALAIGFNGKLNRIFTEEYLGQMFSVRLLDMKASSSENYIRGYSSMLQGLEETGVTVDVSKAFFDEQVGLLDMAQLKVYDTNRALKNPVQAIALMYDIDYTSGVLTELIIETGLRISEAYEVIKNPDKHLQEGTLSNVTGKGNHVYIDKQISWELSVKIQNVKKISHQNTFRNHLRLVDAKPHDLRYTFAKYLEERLLKDGLSLNQARKIVSEELNHNRLEITIYYEKRA